MFLLRKKKDKLSFSYPLYTLLSGALDTCNYITGMIGLIIPPRDLSPPDHSTEENIITVI